MQIKVAILTISDRCHQGRAADASGKVLRDLAQRQGWLVADSAIVPDKKKKIAAAVRRWCDKKDILVVVTTGGTGLGPRDLTPEALRPLFDREVAGFGELMRMEGLKKTPMAALSRSTAGTRGESLIVCLPGSPKGASESFAAVAGLIPHVLSIIKGGGH